VERRSDRRDGPRLTTTSFAILGLLSISDWSSYELASQMRRSLHHFWPRAASGIYEEPKRLVQHGLAEAHPGSTGRRRRTVYRITRAGREALRRWVEDSGADGRAYESEPLVRFFFGNIATKEALLQAIDQVGAGAKAALASWIDVAGPYAEGHGRFPERLPVNAVVMRLAFDIALVELAWAEWARAEVGQWIDATGPADPGQLRVMLAERLSQVPEPSDEALAAGVAIGDRTEPATRLVSSRETRRRHRS